MRRFVHGSIDSTNAEAQRLIAGGLHEWALVTAAEQTGGRGRSGRTWVSPPGNLHASFVVPKDARTGWSRAWLLGYAAALAVHESVAAFVEDGSEVGIKWPNDVTVGGAKVAGLLLEAASGAPAVVVGAGVNVAQAPPGTPYPATALDRHRAAPAAVGAVLERLAAALPVAVDLWLSDGFDTVRAAVLARTHRVGDPLVVRSERAPSVEGAFVDIDADGLLVLEVRGALRRFSTGDVFPSLKD
jgi:BirA family biotin operon repressor/biotin-[acetyl-CoA-carboxylase] ligase